MAKDRKAPQKFVRASYSRSNAWAIEVVKEFLLSQSYNIHSKQEDYGPDIKAEKNSVIEYFEVETKTNYTFTNQENFKFPTVSFLARKEKWKDIGFWYVIVCRETRACIKCHSSVIYQEQFKEKLKINSKERLGTDTFYRVPKELCEWLTLKND